MRSLWPQRGRWRHGDFLKLWSGQTISLFGTLVSQLAIPLAAILVLGASAFEVAVLGMVVLPFLLFALPAGVWVDGLRRKPILVLADLGRAIALASIPLAYAADALTSWQLYVVGFVTGTLTVLFDVSYQSYLPSLVERGQLVEGNSKLEVSRSGVGGILATPVGLHATLWIGAIGSTAAFLPVLLSPVRSIGPMSEAIEQHAPAVAASPLDA